MTLLLYNHQKFFTNMSTPIPKIIWEKWIDPLGIDSQDDTITDEYDDIHEYSPYKEPKIEKIKMIITPFGAIPYNEYTASGKIFNFWNGHTNFPITKTVFNAIELTDGVETLDLFTKYRFRVGIGKAFVDSEIMRDINTNVYKVLEY